VVEKLVPVPLDGVPPVAVQLMVTAPVPPLVVAVQATAVPTVPVVGQVTVTVKAFGLMVTVAEAVAVTAFASVTVTLTVWAPVVAYCVVKLVPVPLDGVPPVAVHANV
jgi:hypothetical protein